MKAEGRKQKWRISAFCFLISDFHVSVEREPLKRQVILFGFVSLLNDSASEMIFPLLPVFLTSTLGTTALVVGIIEGSADAVASILKLAAGAWSDRLALRKPPVTTGYALAAGSR